MEIIEAALLMGWIPIGLGLLQWPMSLLLALILKSKLPVPRDTSLIEGLFLFLIYFLLMVLPKLLFSFDEEAPPDPVPEEVASSEAVAEEKPLSLEENLLKTALILGILSLGALLYLSLCRGKESLAAVGFTIRKPGITLAFSITAYFSFIPVYFLFCYVNRLFIPYERQRILTEMVESPENQTAPLVLLCVSLLIPMLEEILFRGLLLSGLKAIVPSGAAVFVSSIIFGLAHEPSAIFPVFSLGLILGYLKVRTGSLFPCILVHGLHNFLMVLLLPFLLR